MQLTAISEDKGKRLDALLHERMPEFSRSRLQTWIKASRVMVDGKPEKSSYQIRGVESILVDALPLPPLKASAEDIPLEILYEDDCCVVINKPAGMVVHAGAGVHNGTLVNALLHHFKSLSAVGGDLRPGIVHRLDRFTSGCLVVAKEDASHLALAKQFAGRTVEKIYLTLVEGRLEGKGRITRPITRDPRNRARMTARLDTGRNALTDWEAVENFRSHTFLRIRIGTGRTHQIRAHMAYLSHPVAGDKLYGGRVAEWNRYFLHAHRLCFDSPATGKRVTIESPLSPDLAAWKASLNG